MFDSFLFCSVYGIYVHFPASWNHGINVLFRFNSNERKTKNVKMTKLTKTNIRLSGLHDDRWWLHFQWESVTQTICGENKGEKTRLNSNSNFNSNQGEMDWWRRHLRFRFSNFSPNPFVCVTAATATKLINFASLQFNFHLIRDSMGWQNSRCV